jgi:hypothetical protein
MAGGGTASGAPPEGETAALAIRPPTQQWREYLTVDGDDSIWTELCQDLVKELLQWNRVGEFRTMYGLPDTALLSAEPPRPGTIKRVFAALNAADVLPRPLQVSIEEGACAEFWPPVLAGMEIICEKRAAKRKSAPAAAPEDNAITNFIANVTGAGSDNECPIDTSSQDQLFDAFGLAMSPLHSTDPDSRRTARDNAAPRVKVRLNFASPGQPPPTTLEEARATARRATRAWQQAGGVEPRSHKHGPFAGGIPIPIPKTSTISMWQAMKNTLEPSLHEDVLADFACALLRTSCKAALFDISFPDKYEFQTAATKSVSVKRAENILSAVKTTVPSEITAIAAASIITQEAFQLQVQPTAMRKYREALNKTMKEARKTKSTKRTKHKSHDTDDSDSDSAGSASSDMSGADVGTKKGRQRAGFNTAKLQAITELNTFQAMERIVTDKHADQHEIAVKLKQLIFQIEPEKLANDFARLKMYQVFISDLAKGSDPSEPRRRVCNVFKQVRSSLGTYMHKPRP